MCGIVGFIQKSDRLKKDELVILTDTLSHRGPDASGVYYDSFDQVGLGHTRLSIIDLSVAANQPMESHCGRYLMVYNGEVYNYKEIRDEIIKSSGINFKTHSDSEVILEAFAIWGVKCVDKFNGMFAIAIWDKQEKELYLFRDRIGIKPLFYFKTRSFFFFASELKAIQKLQKYGFDLEINQNAINSFLHLGYIPTPFTIYGDVYKFPQGYYGVVDQTCNLSVESYWLLEDKINKTVIDDETAKDQLLQMLENSVSYRMIADVPVGTFLSGGVDSSLVAAIASSQTSKPIKTFSIGFEESKFDESKFAKKVSDYLGTDHHEYILSEKEAMSLMEDIIPTFDEPFADTSSIPTMLVSHLARKEVKVALTGDGGDEQFMGYGAYTWAKRLDHPIIETTMPVLNKILSNSGNDRLRRVSGLFTKTTTGIRNHIFSQEQYLFANNELNAFLVENLQNYFSYFDPVLDRKLNSMEKQSLFDLKYYLPDDLLVKVDRASMKFGLECRLPLLDYRIVEFTLNLSEKFKQRGKVTKWLLKQILYDYVPREYFERPKWGFGIPLIKWLKNDMSYLLHEFLSEDMVNKVGVVRYENVYRMKRLFLKGHDHLYNRLWTLILLHWWMKEKEVVNV